MSEQPDITRLLNEVEEGRAGAMDLTRQEKKDLVRFLKEALVGKITKVEIPRLP